MIRLKREASGYSRRGFAVEPATLEGKRAWRVRDMQGLSATDFVVKTLGDVRRWFAWLEGNPT